MFTDTLSVKDGLKFNLSIAESYNGFYYRNFNTKEQKLLTAPNVKDLILSVLLSEDSYICCYKTTIIDWINVYADRIFIMEGN